MKTFLTSLWLLIGALLVPVSMAAQGVVGFGSPQSITGNATSPPVATITSAWRVAPITLNLTNLNNGNAVTGFVGNVYLSQNPTNLSGASLIGSVTLTNWSGEFDTNFIVYYTNVPSYIILQAQTGTNVVGVKEVYGP